MQPADPPVEIRTSTRRRKTATAYWQQGTIVVVLPARLAGTARAEMVQSLVGRVLSQRPHVRSSDEELASRARYLAGRYLHGTLPSSIRWVSNQQRRWGSCSPHSGEIRISARLRVVPPWVLDAVLVHELAHLDEASHSQRFRELVARYPRTDDAEVFLEGFTLGLERHEAEAEPSLF